MFPADLSQGGTDTSQGKVNILLQAYISKAYIEDFALVSDTGFVQQVRAFRTTWGVSIADLTPFFFAERRSNHPRSA